MRRIALGIVAVLLGGCLGLAFSGLRAWSGHAGWRALGHLEWNPVVAICIFLVVAGVLLIVQGATEERGDD